MKKLGEKHHPAIQRSFVIVIIYREKDTGEKKRKNKVVQENEPMSAGSTLKERLAQEIDKLPEDRLQEVFNFVGYLLSIEQQAREKESKMDLNPAKDPILSFIGGVSHGRLAKDIDSELYGEVR